MNIYIISSILAASTCFLLSFFIILKGSRNIQNKLFSIATIFTGIWCTLPFVSSLPKDDNIALSYVRIVYLFAVFVPATWLNFHLTILEQAKTKLKLIILIYLISLPWVVLVFHPKFIKGIVRSTSFYLLVPGPLYLFFFLFFAIVMVVVLFNLFKGHRESQGHKKNQLKYILLASIISIIGGFIHFISAYLKIEPIPHDIFIIIFPCIITYAIVKYRLMDIAVAITRTTIFVVLFSLVLGLPFIFVALYKQWLIGVLGTNWWLGPTVLMAALGTSGPFTFFYIEKKALAILLREQRRYQETLRHAAVDITRIRNLQKLLDFIISLFNDAVRITHSAIYISDAKTRKFFLKASLNIQKEQPDLISRRNPLITWLEEHKEPLVYEEIKQKYEDNSDSLFKGLEEQMRSLNATVVVPCLLEGKLLDILVLGDKLSGKIYTSEDLDNFAELAREVALATENALLYGNIEEEVSHRTQQLIDVQKQLIQAEKLASVGTLAGGVAHEINNPLTAILTNVQMLLADYNAQDTDTKESLELIEEATQRCRTIVQKLMTYAKQPLEATGVSEVNMANVVKNVVSLLRYQFEQDNIKITTDVKENNYLVKGNQNELEQVVTNMVLNARDAIRKIKKSGTINMSVSGEDGWVKIEIKDDGCGIPKEIMPKIFDPFFTTKDIGKGLGLGLSICHSIIEKHKGTITVKSELNKGSVFTVKIPKKT